MAAWQPLLARPAGEARKRWPWEHSYSCPTMISTMLTLRPTLKPAAPLAPCRAPAAGAPAPAEPFPFKVAHTPERGGCEDEGGCELADPNGMASGVRACTAPRSHSLTPSMGAVLGALESFASAAAAALPPGGLDAGVLPTRSTGRLAAVTVAAVREASRGKKPSCTIPRTGRYVDAAPRRVRRATLIPTASALGAALGLAVLT